MRFSSIIGNETAFTLEHRLFNAACFYAMCIALLAVGFNTIQQSPKVLVMVPFWGGAVNAVLYYYSRFRGMYRYLIFPFYFLGSITLSALFFLSAGSFGNTVHFFMLFFLIINSTAGYFYKRIISLLITLNIGLLFWIQHAYPTSVIEYQSTADMMFDWLSVVFIVFPFTFLVISTLIHSYYQEKKKVEQANEQLKILALTDPMTKLFNRLAMLNAITVARERAIRSKEEVVLIIADIDLFKKVNDTYGHECGDKVIIRVAKILKEALRGQDLISRWGGEEFLMMLPNTSLVGGAEVARKIKELLARETINYEGQNLNVSLTFGVTTWDVPNEAIDKTIKRADEALYEGKENGRNCIITKAN